MGPRRVCLSAGSVGGQVWCRLLAPDLWVAFWLDYFYTIKTRNNIKMKNKAGAVEVWNKDRLTRYLSEYNTIQLWSIQYNRLNHEQQKTVRSKTWCQRCFSKQLGVSRLQDTWITLCRQYGFIYSFIYLFILCLNPVYSNSETVWKITATPFFCVLWTNNFTQPSIYTRVRW